MNSKLKHQQASAPSKKPIDLQYLALRINHHYQQFDMKMSGSKLVKIETSSNGGGGQRNKYCVQKTMDTKQPTVDNFFSNFSDRGLFGRVELEDIYWKIRLRFGCSIVTIALLKAVQDLISCGYSIVGKLGNEIQTFAPDDLALRVIHFKPKISNIVETSMMFPFGLASPMIQTDLIEMNGISIHNIIVVKNNYVLDPSAMQFGLRGSKMELIGKLEERTKYFSRFQSNLGEICYFQDQLSPEEETFNIEGQYKLNEFCIKPTIKATIDDVKKNVAWCFYCGGGNGTFSLQKCTRCQVALYCGKQCQKSDWLSHKRYCHKP